VGNCFGRFYILSCYNTFIINDKSLITIIRF